MFRQYRSLQLTLTGSFLLHAIVLFSATPFKDKPVSEPHTNNSKLISISLVKQKLTSESAQSNKANIKKRGALPATKKQKTKIKTYAELLQVGEYSEPSTDISKKKEKLFREKGGYQGGVSQEELNRGLANSSELQVFAKEIVQMTYIPFFLKKSSHTGASFMLLRRKKENKNQWEIKKIVGNSYLRASLFESVAATFLSSSTGLTFLCKSDYSFIHISLSFERVPDFVMDFPPLSINILENKISITHRYKNISPALSIPIFQMAEPEIGKKERVQPLVNVVGVLSTIGSFFPDSKNKKKSIKRLELESSPAFISSILGNRNRAKYKLPEH